MLQPSLSHSKAKELVSFGKVGRELRLEKSWLQVALADYAGIDQSYFGGIERGEHNLALINLIKIASTLGIKAASLLEIAKL